MLASSGTRPTTLNVYASYGEGFETPTFAELAYRPGRPRAQPRPRPGDQSTSVEVGLKCCRRRRQRVNLAVFARRHADDEIVVDTATGGRTTYRNASDTRRRGVEAAWDGDLGRGLHRARQLFVAQAEFAEPPAPGMPPAPVPAGRAAARASRRSRRTAMLVWTPGGLLLASGGGGGPVRRPAVRERPQHRRCAPAYTIGNVRVGFAQRVGDARMLREFVRVEQRHRRATTSGSVIVGDTNGAISSRRPGRNWFAGAECQCRFASDPLHRARRSRCTG